MSLSACSKPLHPSPPAQERLPTWAQRELRPFLSGQQEVDRSLALGRATYERWLGTEPEEITAAADALRHFEPSHPSLVNLEVRLRRARQIKAMLFDILHPELASDDDEDWRRL